MITAAALSPAVSSTTTPQVLASAGLPEGVELWPTVWILVAVFLVTVALRGLPFAALKFFKESQLVAWLGLVMPVGVMTVLAIYATTTTAQEATSGDAAGGSTIAGIPMGWIAVALGIAFVVAAHLWRRSASLSILLGTVFYVVLVNWVF